MSKPYFDEDDEMPSWDTGLHDKIVGRERNNRMHWTLEHSEAAGKWLGIATLMAAFAVLNWWSWPNPFMCTLNGFMAGITFWKCASE